MLDRGRRREYSRVQDYCPHRWQTWQTAGGVGDSSKVVGRTAVDWSRLTPVGNQWPSGRSLTSTCLHDCVHDASHDPNRYLLHHHQQPLLLLARTEDAPGMHGAGAGDAGGILDVDRRETATTWQERVAHSLAPSSRVKRKRMGQGGDGEVAGVIPLENRRWASNVASSKQTVTAIREQPKLKLNQQSRPTANWRWCESRGRPRCPPAIGDLRCRAGGTRQSGERWAMETAFGHKARLGPAGRHYCSAENTSKSPTHRWRRPINSKTEVF